MNKENQLHNTKWDNSNIFSSQVDPRLKSLLVEIEGEISKLKTLAQDFTDPSLSQKTTSPLIARAQESALLKMRLQEELYKIGTFANMALSTNSKDVEAQKNYFKVRSLLSDIEKNLKPIWGYLSRLDAESMQVFLNHPEVKTIAPEMEQLQKFKNFLLSPAEESIIATLQNDGHHSWGNLYNDLSSSLSVKIDDQTYGLATATNMMDVDDPTLRQKAYRGIHAAWTAAEVPASYILNSIYGWRLESYKLRSQKENYHFLDATCFSEKISRKTLQALMTATEKALATSRKSLELMAGELGQSQLGPWDLLIGYPHKTNTEPISFPAAMEIIISAFNEFDPKMGEFARLAWQKNWIDGAESENRRTGAYCTTIYGVREPRVFMTFDGSIKNLLTLAHELGHGYHSWVMKDMPLGLSQYTAGVAETASIFAETLVRGYMLKNAKNVEAKKQVLWQELVSISSLMVNIPARFEFEKNMMEERQNGIVPAARIKSLCESAWKKWYGGTLSEYNSMFWASKLHFSLTGISFYNYPYLMGYLFSLGIYFEGQKMGPGFAEVYRKLLCDTGVLSAEGIIEKYFKKNIQEESFWQDSIQVALKSISEFENLS